jgi:hypothetical protein
MKTKSPRQYCALCQDNILIARINKLLRLPRVQLCFPRSGLRPL